MADKNNRRAMKYESYGNVAYVPEVQTGTTTAPGREQGVPLPRRRLKKQTKVLTRGQVQLREADAVAPFGLMGFVLVGALAVALLFTQAQSVQLSTEVASLQQQYSAALVEKASLSAQYERLFDISSIEAAVAGTMVRPSADQVVYLDLSKPDQVNNHDAEHRVDGIGGLFAGLGEIVTEIKEYF